MTSSQRSGDLRSFYADYVTRKGDAKDRRIRDAFAMVPRESYAGPGPWLIPVPGRGQIPTPSDDVAYLYQDTLVVIDARRGINIGEPSLHARCLQALRIAPGETVLHVGAGVGYYTAILAALVGPTGHVLALEIEPDLAERAETNLGHLPWVTVECRSGLSPEHLLTDVVYVNAGLPDIPASWRQLLKPKGRLLFPLQATNESGGMLRIERHAGDGVWPARFVCRAGFIGLEGGQEQGASRRLSDAFRAGHWDEVRSFRLDADKVPDASCWLRGDGWWLSRSGPGEPIILPNG